MLKPANMSDIVVDCKKMQMFAVKCDMKPVKDSSYLKCETCHKVFSRSWLLKNHQRVHTGERPYKCTFCDKAFADKSNLRQHMKIHTTKEKLFQCGICERTFAQRRYLAKHVSEIHRESTLPMFGVPVKRKKSSEGIKAELGKPAPETKPELVTKVVDHQYLTRHKSKQTIPADTSPKKYSEQDLKDFIKSSQKTMEKNGFIFIKQNFDMFEGAEPTLTEISDGEGQVKPESSSSTGEQTETQAKNVVKIIDSGTSVRVGKLKPDGSREIDLQTMNMHLPKLKKYGNMLSLNEGKTGKSVNILGKKRQTLNQTGDRNVLVGVNGQSVRPNKSAPMIVKPVPAPISAPQLPLQLLKAVPAPIIKPDAVQFVQLVQGGVGIPTAAPSNGPIIMLPVTLQTALPLQGVLQPTPVLSQSNMKNSPLTITASKMISHEAEAKPLPVDGSFILPSSYNNQVLESQAATTFITKVSPMDEKGDNGGGCIGQQVLSATPVVSDAPWQGVLNINSEQELLEYINSHSTSGEGDKNLTIFIQNVDGQGGGVAGPLALDNQMLSGISSLGDGFVDQGMIMSDVLPTVSNVEEVHVNADNSVNLTDNMHLLGAETAADIPMKTEQEINMGETSVVFSVSGDIQATSLSIDDTMNNESEGAAMIISDGMIPVEHSTEGVHVNENVQQVTHEVKADQDFSNCESEHFSEHVTLLEPTIVDVHVGETVHHMEEESVDMVHDTDVTGECDETRKSLYTDHDFYSVPVPVSLTEVDHGVDHDQTESQCYNDSVMLNTQEVTLDGPSADDP